MTKKEFYNYLLVFTADFDFRLKNVKSFDDPVFVNGQKWQIENKRSPIFSFGNKGWIWCDYSKYPRCQLPKDIFNKLSKGTLLYSIDTNDSLLERSIIYNDLQEAEEDLAQVLKKLRKPLIIHLTSTGFEIK